MKRILLLTVLLVILATITPRASASSAQAYTDFQYQFDQYRNRLNEYNQALTNYQQFNSLTSQQETLDKSKLLIAQRSVAAKSYFLFLNEKLNEDPGVGAGEKATVRTTMTNQIALMDKISSEAPPVQSLDDATKLSQVFVKNYFAMQISYRQTIVQLQLGYINYFAGVFDTVASQSQLLINASRGQVSPEKQAVLDRWLLALSTIHSTYQQQYKTIQTALPKIAGDVLEQDRQFAAEQKTLEAARQNLAEGASYLKELENALRYE